MATQPNSCVCRQTYTVTETWEETFYTVPKITNAPTENNSCKCQITGKEYGGAIGYVECNGAPTGTITSASVESQDPAAGTKVTISGPTKTGSKKEPDLKCVGDCNSSQGPPTLKKDESKGTGDTKSVSIEVKVKGILNCSCDPIAESWDESCSYTATVQMDAEVMKRTRVQSYDVTLTCKNK